MKTMKYTINTSGMDHCQALVRGIRKSVFVIGAAFILYAVLFAIYFKDVRPEFRIFVLIALMVYVTKTLFRFFRDLGKFRTIAVELEVGPKIITITTPGFILWGKELPMRNHALAIERVRVEEITDIDLSLALKISNQGSAGFLIPYTWFSEPDQIRDLFLKLPK